MTSFGGRVGLGLFGLIAIIPIGLSLVYALSYSIGLVGLLGDGLTLEHWMRVLGGGELWRSFVLSFYVAALSTILTFSASLVIVLFLRKQLEREPLGTMIYLPLAIPATVAAFLVLQFLSGSGLVARALLWLGFGAAGDVGAGSLIALTNDKFAVGIVVAHVLIAVPFFVLLLAQTYKAQQIHKLNQVAAGLGTPKRSRLTRITLPILIRRVMPNTVLFFIYVLGAYEIPLLLGRQSPQMVSVLAMRKYARFDITQKPEAFVIAILYAALVAMALVLLRRHVQPSRAE